MNRRYPKLPYWSVPFTWGRTNLGYRNGLCDEEMFGPDQDAWAGLHMLSDGMWFVKVIVAGGKYRTSFRHRFQARAWGETVLRGLVRDPRFDVGGIVVRRHKPIVGYMSPLYRTCAEIAAHDAWLATIGGDGDIRSREAKEIARKVRPSTDQANPQASIDRIFRENHKLFAALAKDDLHRCRHGHPEGHMGTYSPPDPM